MIQNHSANGKLKPLELRKRASNIKLMLADNDGVLTDAGVYYSAYGEELKRFSIRDGMGVERLLLHGIQTAIISGENSESIKRRAEKLALPFLFLGVRNKRGHLERILTQTTLNIEQIAYIGDDLLDQEIMLEIGKRGLTAAPCDGMPDILRIVHYRCKLGGGQGAFREFAEWILKLRNNHAI